MATPAPCAASVSTSTGAGRVATPSYNGKTTTYGYDPNNNWLTSKMPDPSLGEPAITFTYKPSGQRETMSDAHGVTVYGYDVRNRLQTRQTPEGTLTYGYEGGNLASVSSSNAEGVSIAYQYDTLNRLEHVVDHRQGDATTSYGFDDVGTLSTVSLPNGVTTGYTFNTLNRLTNVTSRRGATSIASYTYTLGDAGNRTKVVELGGRTVQYTYDDIYRLTSETISADTHGNNGTIGYGFDDVGNRLSRTSTVAAVPSTTSTYDLNDRLTTDGYNANGETIASSGNTYRYDFEGRLLALNPGTPGEVRYVYDGDGNRVAKTENGVTTSYLVDTMNPTGYAQVVEELVGGAVVRQYSYGLDLISQRQLFDNQWSTSFYLYDGHGNVRALTDAAGNVTDTYDYDAWGILIHQAGSIPNTYLYCGEQFDVALQLYYLRARYLSPKSGRFQTMDKFEGHRHDPRSLHWYGYATNNPVMNSDPSGYETLQNIQFSQRMMVALAGITVLLATAPLLTQRRPPRPRPQPVPSPEPGSPPAPVPVPYVPPDDRPDLRNVKFVHGTSEVTAHDIDLNGLSQQKILANEFGSRSPGSFFTFPLGDDPIAAIENALAFAGRDSRRPRPLAAMIGTLPGPVFDNLVKAGWVEFDSLGPAGLGAHEWIFLPPSYPVLDAYNRGKWEILVPPQ